MINPDKNKRQIKYIYDRYGRLLSMKEDLKSVDYTYDSKGRLSKRVTGGIPVYFTYTELGQLKGKYLNAPGKEAIASVEYNYSSDGQIVSRSLSGKLEQFEYDAMNRLLAVKDANGKYQEKYVYDPAGNMLEKTVDGKTSKFEFDKSNQLTKASMPDGSTTVYNYDGAGRLVSEVNSKSGRKDYKYAWLDKVIEMNKTTASSSGRTEDTMSNYYADGQLSDQITVGGGSESFYWDGLALLRRDDTNLTNEPAVTGGNPIMANGKVLFNDMLGSTVGSLEKGKYTAPNLNLFGNILDNSSVDKYNYFTGY